MTRPLIGAAVLALVLTATAAGRSSGTLQLNASFNTKINQVSCQAGTPDTTGCYPNLGSSVIPGLGNATESYTELIDSATACGHTTFTPVVISVAGKGEIDASLTDPYSCDPQISQSATIPYTITGGTGKYAGATGSGVVNSSPFNQTGAGSGTETHTWVGTLTVAGVDFDLSAPTITGATARIVKTKSAAGARVRFAVTATDAVDGAVPVTCLPKSGSLFRIGRTTVTCTATDSSANTATARFSVTVKRVRR